MGTGDAALFALRVARPGDDALCESILRALPDWFGIESSLLMYARDSARYPTWIAELAGNPAGFITLNRHFPASAEVHCMAVLREHHRRGIGRAMIELAESWCRGQGIAMLQVKTQGPSKYCEQYAGTTRFYERVGFVPLEELHGLWPGIPCLVLVKPVA